MNLPVCKSWALGRYTVRQAVRMDNAYWPQFVIMRAGKVVGYSFSVPDRAQCESIERITASGRYVEKSTAPKYYSYRLPKQNAESARKATRSVKVRKIIAAIG